MALKHVLGFGLTLAFAGVAQAGPYGLNTQISNFTWDNEALNSPPTVTKNNPTYQPPNYLPDVDNFPQDVVFAYSASGTGSVLVKDYGPLNNALEMSTAYGGASSYGVNGLATNWVDTQFVASTGRVVLDFDALVHTLPNGPLAWTNWNGTINDNDSNPLNNVAYSHDFSFNGYHGGSSVLRISRIVIGHISDTEFVVGVRPSESNNNLIAIAYGDEGDLVHVQMDADLVTDTADYYVSINGVAAPALLNVPFMNIMNGAANSSVQEWQWIQNSAEGDLNLIYVDNVMAFVPEPGSLALLGLGGLAALSRRRRA